MRLLQHGPEKSKNGIWKTLWLNTGAYGWVEMGTWYGGVWLQSCYAEDECSVVPDILYNSGVMVGFGS